MGGEILFLAHRLPFPPDRGDRIRSANVLRALARIAPVHVGCFVDSEADRTHETELCELTASTCVVTRSKPLPLAGIEALLRGEAVSVSAYRSARLSRWVAELLASGRIAAVYVFSGQMGQFVPADFAGKVVVDLCDVDSAKFEAYAESGQRPWLNRREARLLAGVEEGLGHRAAATILISEAEATLYAGRLRDPSGVNIRVIGNGVDAGAFDPASVQPHPAITARRGPHFVFTGQMDYPPNEQAALWTIGAFLPVIRQEYPDAEFHVVGRNPTPLLLGHRYEPGVTVWGEVPDVRPFLAAATCVLAPLTIARGIQNKVLEAMAMARPVMLTPEAATGIAATDGMHWLIAPAENEAMHDRAVALLGDPVAQAAMGRAARRFVLEQQSWSVMLAPLADLLGLHPAQPEQRNVA